MMPTKTRARNHGPWLLASLLAGAPLAFGQGAEFAAPAAANAAGENGLDEATPSDDIGEVGGDADAQESGNGALDAGGGEAFNGTGGGQQQSGDELFDNGSSGEQLNQAPANQAEQAAADNGAEAVNAAANPLPSNTPINTLPNNAPVNALPGNAPQNIPAANALGTPPHSLPTQSAPTNVPAGNIFAPANGAAPADAQALMDQLAPASGAPAAAVPEPSPGPTAPPLPAPNEFAGAPPVPGSLRLMAEGEAPDEYRVERGDSLYDICDQLLDEAGYWPKLWSLNPEIKNPHFIFPNMRLKFYPGDDDNPPYLQVVTEEDVIPIDKGDLDEQELIAEKVIFPAEAAAEDTIVEVIGAEQLEGGEELSDMFLAGGRRFQGDEIKVQVPGFIVTEEKDVKGLVLAGRDDDPSVRQDNQVFLQGSGEIGAGQTYTVVRQASSVESPDSGDFVGYRYYFVANVKVERALSDGMLAGTVVDSRLGVARGDQIVDYISTSRSVPSGGVVGALSPQAGSVVAFEYPDQELGGEGSYAFIDRGSQSGVSPGMYVPLYGTPGSLTMTVGALDLPGDYQLAGVMRIIDVTDAAAVGYIVRTAREVRIGDRGSK